MLFSNPDYPLFLIAVFFLYALSRTGGATGRWARVAVMIVLGDLVYMLIAKDPALLWDPLGSAAYQLAANGAIEVPDATTIVHWLIGAIVLAAALAAGTRGGPPVGGPTPARSGDRSELGRLGSERGQRWVARGMIAVVLAVGAAVAIASEQGVLPEMSAIFAAHGHLLVLFVLGVGVGAAQVNSPSGELPRTEPRIGADADARPIVRCNSHRTLGRVIILFVASGLFYQAWAVAMPGPYRYLLALLLFTIVLDYYLGIWIENSQAPAVRKLLVVVSLCSNLGILFFFKYAHFFGVWPRQLILPAGISFHTFQSLSYTIDVYRKQLRATRSPIQFATFVLFFPQLVAGPIVRAQDLLPQLADLPALELEKATRGLYRIVVGLFKKIALADTLALAIVDRVFEKPGHFTRLEVIAGVYGYAFQIYLDFSAYSDIAIGSAQVLGFDLPENFRTPYRSANLQEFWRRWHISLSTWLRDYLYISLGGSRGAEWRTYINLSLTMLLGGLWHGANWTFVVWGGLHGFGLAMTRFFQRTRDPRTMFALCAAIAIGGGAVVSALPADTDAWNVLWLGWVTVTPLWAVATAWLSRVEWPPVTPRETSTVELLRIASCAAGVAMIASLHYCEPIAWIPLVVLAWALAVAADLVANGTPPPWTIVRRVIAGILTFHYVCFAWIFFRAPSFADALAVLRQIAHGDSGHANVTPMVQTALAVGLAAHLWADGTFRWMRARFVALPPVAQGALLAACALVLRELSSPKLVKFIYFEF